MGKPHFKVVKQDERYTVSDNTDLNAFVVSRTILYAGQQTTGHKHKGQEEVYLFTRGDGRMELDDEILTVSKGDIVLVEDGQFHRVYNPTLTSLEFVCIFNGTRQA